MTTESSGVPSSPRALVTIAQAVRDGAARLDGIAENPPLESRLLLAHALGLSRSGMIRDPEQHIDTTPFKTLLARRITREPIAFIIGRREFWSLDFQVSRATLIPRPDSETVIDAALAAFAGRPPPRRILDLGTGTGCLLLALLTEFPCAFGVGLDVVPDAASLAKTNAAELGLAGRSAFFVSDWTNPLAGRFDLIVSNPPYIPDRDIDGLMPDVGRFEPRQALDGGADGCDAYRIILSNLRHNMEPNGVAVLELGRGQATYVGEQARAAGFHVSLRLDLAQIPRAIVLTLPNRKKKQFGRFMERVYGARVAGVRHSGAPDHGGSTSRTFRVPPSTPMDRGRPRGRPWDAHFGRPTLPTVR